MWSSLVKIQYTELKLSCGNDPVVKNSIYSNGDLDLWSNDPKICRVLPLPQGNHVAKFGKDPIYRTKVIVCETCVDARLPAIPNHIIRPLLSNYWWQRSDIWSQASYRYPISFLDPSDSYFLFAEERGYHKWALAHSSSCFLHTIFKFGKDPIYRTKVIVRKRSCCQKLYL
jgi:hypothetical protein